MKRLSRNKIKETAGFYVFILPWLVGISLLTIGPMCYSVYYSLCDYNVLQPPFWVGIDNYRTILASDAIFPKAVYNTVYYAVLSVPLGIIAGLGLAVLLNQAVKGLRFFRTAFYLPSVIPDVASAVMWLFVFNPELGLVNRVLRLLGLRGPLWLADPHWIKLTLVVMSLWGVGGGMVIFLAGLQGVPAHLYEAADIDGAGWWRKFLAVTLPALTPTIFFNLITGAIAAFGFFTTVYIVTGNSGGPLNSAYFYMPYLFNQAFQYFQMGYASALAWLFFAAVAVFTVVQFRLSRRWVYYEGD